MLSFHKHYENVKTIVLEDNYRSRQEILDTASALIENNLERLVGKLPNLEKKLVAKNQRFSLENRKPQFMLTQSDTTEKISVLHEIQSLKNKGIDEKEIAIITRNNREVQEWSDFLKLNGLNVESKVKTNILNSPYIHFLLDFLALVLDPYESDVKLINVLRTRIIDVENIDIIKINRYLYSENYTRKDKIRLFDIFRSEKKLAELELKDISKVISFRDMILKLSSSITLYSFVQFFDVCIRETKIIDFIESEGTFEDLQDIYTLFNTIKDF